MTTAPLFNWLTHRSVGCLAHVSSLPSNHGIGNIGSSAYAFIDLLFDCHLKSWQICPLGPTGYGDSPYSAFSAFAGNPYFIDWQELVDAKLIGRGELFILKNLPKSHVDYGELYLAFWPLANRAAHRWVAQPFDLDPEYTFERFREEEAHWIDDFALFRVLKTAFHGRCWLEWPKRYRNYQDALLEPLPKGARHEDILAEIFLQYVFFHQMRRLRAYARDAGVEIIGDLPIFIALDSADAWSRPELFLMDEVTGEPAAVAGVPPDYFSETGQLWGNPLYDWERHQSDGYAWWMHRFESAFRFYDIARLDHFRGFEAYWSIPADAPDAREGKWQLGPGLDLFRCLKQRIPHARILAEDLGTITPEVNALRDATGIPGMAVLQFAFGGEADNWYLPHNHSRNQAVYTGSHDNDTSLGWYRTADARTQDHFRRYFRVDGGEAPWDLIRAAYASPCNLAVILLQDFLSLDSAARFNTPGVPQGNWQWRATAQELETFYSKSRTYIKGLAALYGRH